jgi:transcription elongation factor GreA
MARIITKECYNMIVDKIKHLRNNEINPLSEHVDECRLNGSLEDNPEYYSSLERLNALYIKLDELNDILNTSQLFTRKMLKEDTVTFGTTVRFVNCDTDVEKEYTLVSIYDSDISKGYISSESPFAKEMLGLHTGDTFSFNDDEYEIINICCVFQE